MQLQVVDFAIIISRQTMEDIQSVLCSHPAAGKVGKLVPLRFEESRVWTWWALESKKEEYISRAKLEAVPGVMQKTMGHRPLQISKSNAFVAQSLATLTSLKFPNCNYDIIAVYSVVCELIVHTLYDDNCSIWFRESFNSTSLGLNSFFISMVYM